MSHIEECAFELSYIKKEHEKSGNTIIAQRRVDHGRMLARLFPVESDYIVPIPETAIHYAQGYALESKIPLVHAVFKNRPKPKTLFINDRKEVIGDVFTIMPKFITNKELTLVDETVISGLSLKTILDKISLCKPSAIHLRLANPPMIRKCPSSSFGDNWKFEGASLLGEFKLIKSIKYLPLEVIEKFSYCFYCFGGNDDRSKMVKY